MRDFMQFCLYVLADLVGMLFEFDIGGYSYGDFIVVTLLVSVLVSSLVIRFRLPSAPPSVPRAPGHESGGDGSG